MASIIIKDLAESVDLDRQAMIAIIGGARSGGRPAAMGQTIFQTTRLVNYPKGFARGPGSAAGGASASQSTSR